MVVKKIIYGLFFAFALQAAVPAQASVWTTITSWFSSKENQKRSLMGVFTLGLGYFMYKLWQAKPKQKNQQQSDAGHRPHGGGKGGKARVSHNTMGRLMQGLRHPSQGSLLDADITPDSSATESKRNTCRYPDILPIIAYEPVNPSSHGLGLLPNESQAASITPAPALANDNGAGLGLGTPQSAHVTFDSQPMVHEVPRVSELRRNMIDSDASQQQDVKDAVARQQVDVETQQSEHKRSAEQADDFEVIDHEEVRLGGQLVKDILNNKKTALALDDVRHMCWFIYSKAKEKNMGFDEGTFVIEDTADCRLLNALKSCPQKYERLSSHFPNRVVSSHYGIDVDHLPIANKQTLVFAQLAANEAMQKTLQGNTLFYVKLEDHGCDNPLNVLRTEGVVPALNAAANGIAHGAQYGRSLVGSMVNSAYHDRPEWNKEHVPAELTQAWNELVGMADMSQTEQERYKKEFGAMKRGSIREMIERMPMHAARGKELAFAGKQKSFTNLLALAVDEQGLDHFELRKGREAILRLPELRQEKSSGCSVS